FPMGILHKLVFILSKIDEHNERWKELQKQRALKETEAAYNLGNKDERHQRLTEIEKAFDFNTSDYGRKLFLIENSIYGVDIQPIAVQIAKLRFFISLIVDQNINKTKENLGILPLPNLETKFVAANTLIGVDKPDQGNFADLKTKDLEKELLIIRHKHFNAKTQKTKRKYREEDKRIRYEISQALKESGWPSDTAEMLAVWDPYDQNQFAGFFDMEWMFGVKDGFDVVIGNPPYVRVDDITKSLKPLYKSSYNTSVGKYDLYYLFFECGINFLSQKGILAYITPNKFCAANSGIALRNLIFNKFDNGEILSTSRLKVFEEVSNYPVISIFRTISNKNIFSIRQALSINELFTPTKNSYELNNHILSVLPEKIIPINVSQKKIDLSVSLLSKFNVLGNYLSISEGLRIPKSYESEKKADNRIVKQYQFNKWSMIEDATYITNKDLLKVISKTSSRYQKIISDKILIAEDALSITATIDYKKYIPQGGIYFGALINDTYDIKVILSLLNSTVLSFIYEILFGGMHMGGGYLRYRKKFLEQLPISKNIKSEQKLIRLFAEKILNAKKTNHTSDTTLLEAETDARVAHLYNLTEEEYSLILKETNCPDPFRVAALNIYRDIARGKMK
ncbi:MAG: Eco57I restriction-modification methylase domain-containing protein, partial [Deltaproteobacteria bacterium]|nr:Eco57I restriction-modification methylase domain-containing protein [Deltaproteobacteria bacterium]